MNFIPCELDLISTPFCDDTMLTYKIELPPFGNKIGFNSLDNEEFTIPYITDTITNSPAGHQIQKQAKKKLWIIDINGWELIKARGAIDKPGNCQTTHGNQRLISVHAEGRYSRGNIQKRFAPDLIKSDLWFHILKLFSQRSLSHQRALVNV